MTNKKLTIAAALTLASAATLAHAQAIRPSYSYPGDTPAVGGLPLGETGFFAIPYVGLAYGRDDNMFQTPSNETASPFYIVSPGIKVDGRRPGMVAQFAYQGQIGRYTDSRDDDYTDNTFKAQVDAAFSGRSFLRVGYDYVRSHDPRGSNDRTLSPTPDKYKQYTPSATFAYGAPGAQGRAEIYYSDAHRSYLNNRATTASADRDTMEYGGAFYWRVAPKTYVLVEARETNISYELTSPNSGDEHRYFLGVTWEATAATTGTLKVGQTRRVFDLSTNPSNTFTSWEGLVTWAPRSYSAFDFYTTRSTTESTGLGSFIITSVSGVNWNHQWSSVLGTGVKLQWQRDDYQGFNRQDDTKTLGLRVGYKFRRWFTLGAEYNHITRDSNSPTFEFDRNIYFLTATASM